MIEKKLSVLSSPSAFCDFKSICLLPNLSKLFEKLVYIQTKNYLTSTSIMPVQQPGFKASHSRTTVLLELKNKLFLALV